MRAYLATLAAAFVCAALAVTALVVVIDPYRLYGLVEAPGLNAVKPGLTRHQEEIKVAHAMARQPRILILGNSRAEIGFNPATLATMPGAGTAYNLAIPGTGLASSRRELRRLLDGGLRPATIIVGVEFLDFLGKASAARPAPGAPAPAPAGASLPFAVDALFSLASLKDAGRTLLIQRDPEAVSMTAEGFNPLREYTAHARHDGYHMLFAQAADASRKRLQAKAPAVVIDDDYAHLRALISDAAGAGAEVRLLVYPYHARLMALFDEQGLGPLFAQWKLGVLDEVARARTAHPALRIDLVDFSGYDHYQCEPVPARKDRGGVTRWYWEAGHFKEALGERMLQRLFQPTDPAPGAEASFGVTLERANAAANEARIAAERVACLAADPGHFVR